MGRYQYSCGDHPTYHEPKGRHDFPSDQRLYGRDWELIVTDLAEHYHDNQDGWEASWPMDFRIYEDGNEVARFEVEKEHRPSFLAWQKDTPQ